LTQTFATEIRIKPEFTLRRVWWPSALRPTFTLDEPGG
jgi:hypothetical protein